MLLNKYRFVLQQSPMNVWVICEVEPEDMNDMATSDISTCTDGHSPTVWLYLKQFVQY